jgi:hypothetical protein
MVVFVNSSPSVYKVVLTTSRRSHPYNVKDTTLVPPQLVFICEDGASLTHTHTHSSSVHILKEVAIAGGRRREVHATSWFILGVLVLVLEIYWQYIIEEFFAGFSPP